MGHGNNECCCFFSIFFYRPWEGPEQKRTWEAQQFFLINCRCQIFVKPSAKTWIHSNKFGAKIIVSINFRVAEVVIIINGAKWWTFNRGWQVKSDSIPNVFMTAILVSETSEESLTGHWAWKKGSVLETQIEWKKWF